MSCLLKMPAARLAVFGGCLLGLAAVFCPGRAGAANKDFALKAGQTCLSCHAKLAKKKYIHPATDNGDGCTDCHQQKDAAVHKFAPLPDPIVSLCLGCHDDPVAKAHKHPPAAEGDCTYCHDPHQSDQAKLLTAPIGDLCLQCHDAGNYSGEVEKGQTVHGPAKNGKCVVCHNPHSAKQDKLLRLPVPDLCWKCHAKPQKDAKGVKLRPLKRLFEDESAHLHPPFAAGDCLDCHQPHASNNIRLLVAKYPVGFYQNYSEDAYALCLNCHDADKFNKPRTLTATNFRNGNLNLHYRHVNKKKGRNCLACHDPHGSRQAHMIVPAFRFGIRELTVNYEATATGGSCAPPCHVKAYYDRRQPANNRFRTTPRVGKAATAKELLGQPGAHKREIKVKKKVKVKGK